MKVDFQCLLQNYSLLKAGRISFNDLSPIIEKSIGYLDDSLSDALN